MKRAASPSEHAAQRARVSPALAAQPAFPLGALPLELVPYVAQRTAWQRDPRTALALCRTTRRYRGACLQTRVLYGDPPQEMSFYEALRAAERRRVAPAVLLELLMTSVAHPQADQTRPLLTLALPGVEIVDRNGDTNIVYTHEQLRALYAATVAPYAPDIAAGGFDARTLLLESLAIRYQLELYADGAYTLRLINLPVPAYAEPYVTDQVVEQGTQDIVVTLEPPLDVLRELLRGYLHQALLIAVSFDVHLPALPRAQAVLDTLSLQLSTLDDVASLLDPLTLAQLWQYTRSESPEARGVL